MECMATSLRTICFNPAAPLVIRLTSDYGNVLRTTSLCSALFNICIGKNFTVVKGNVVLRIISNNLDS